MGEFGDQVPPDDLPRSPTGRVPQWVVDEAQGVAPEDTAWRSAAMASGDTWRAERDGWTRSRRRRPTWRKVVIAAACVAAASIVIGVQVSDRGAGAALGLSETTTMAYGYPVGAQEDARPAGLPLGGLLESPQGDFRFLDHQSDGKTPVTWSPCRPIHYVVRARHEPRGALTLLQAQIAVISQITGLRFVYDGPTEENPSENRVGYQPVTYGERWAPVLFAWASATEIPKGTASDAVGVAGPYGVPVPGGDLTYVTGTVLLDVEFVRDSFRAKRPSMVASTMLHELGHLLGLDHVQNSQALMYPELDPAVITFARGELPGLQSLGRGPCRPGL